MEGLEREERGREGRVEKREKERERKSIITFCRVKSLKSKMEREICQRYMYMYEMSNA